MFHTGDCIELFHKLKRCIKDQFDIQTSIVRINFQTTSSSFCESSFICAVASAAAALFWSEGRNLGIQLTCSGLDLQNWSLLLSKTAPPLVRSVGSFPGVGLAIGTGVKRLHPQHSDLTAFTSCLRDGIQYLSRTAAMVRSTPPRRVSN